MSLTIEFDLLLKLIVILVLKYQSCFLGVHVINLVFIVYYDL